MENKALQNTTNFWDALPTSDPYGVYWWERLIRRDIQNKKYQDFWESLPAYSPYSVWWWR